METILKLWEAAANMKFESIIKGMIVVAFFLWVGTEGRETWLDDTDAQKQDLQTELMVKFINDTAIQETKQDDILQAVQQTQALSQQRYDFLIEQVQADIEDIEDDLN